MRDPIHANGHCCATSSACSTYVRPHDEQSASCPWQVGRALPWYLATIILRTLPFHFAHRDKYTTIHPNAFHRPKPLKPSPPSQSSQNLPSYAPTPASSSPPSSAPQTPYPSSSQSPHSNPLNRLHSPSSRHCLSPPP